MRNALVFFCVLLLAACNDPDEPVVTNVEPAATPPTFDDWCFGTDSTLRGIEPGFGITAVKEAEAANLREEIVGAFETHLHFEQVSDSTSLQIEYSFSDTTWYHTRLSFYPKATQTPQSLSQQLQSGLTKRFGTPQGKSDYLVWTFDYDESLYEVSLIEETEGYDAPRYSVRFHRKNLSFY